MFKHSFKLRPSYYSITLQKKTLTSTKQCLIKETQTTTESLSNVSAPKKWDLYSAVYLERHPIIIKPMNDIEKSYAELLRTIEYERSYLSDHELRKEREKKLASQNVTELTIDSTQTLTIQDLEDAAIEELNSFKFSPMITEDDKCNNLKSPNRKLDTPLVLLTEHKYTKSELIPPQGARLDGETMRQAAERVLQDTCGPNLKVKFYGNAPVGFYKYCYPRKMRENGAYGAKVFYFMAKYISGKPTSKNYVWVDQEYMSKKLPTNIYDCVSQFNIWT